MTTTSTPPMLQAYSGGSSGRFCECRHADGSYRPGWNEIDDEFNRLGSGGLDECAKQIDQSLRDDGLVFQASGNKQEHRRPWRLGPVPIAIGDSDWRELSSGLCQRTRVLEAVLSDLLGPQRLLRERVIPAELLWANPRFFRAFSELSVGDGHRLHVTASNVARHHDGSWWVVSDRTRAPSGLGYLLQNRVVFNSAFPHLLRQANVRRLSGFFRLMRDHFRELSPGQKINPRIVVLTPGRGSYRDYEDAYLARYQGYTLVQGRDLAVRDGGLKLKTLGGLLPIEVLWRQVSDAKCDPMELDPASDEGVSGLLQTIRLGHVAVANAIGTALVEMPALIPFLPAAARCLIGEDLTLPSVATYWCGGAKERNYVLENLGDLIIRDAFYHSSSQLIDPRELSKSQRGELVERIRSSPQDYVGQERLAHSLTPVWHEGRFQPWHVALRMFSLQTSDRIEVMPGALARVSPDEGLLDRSPTAGHLTQDCWFVSEHPIDNEPTHLPGPGEAIVPRRHDDELPSRVAEHLYWLGRYVERCELISRSLRTVLTRLAGEDAWSDTPEMPGLIAALSAMGQISTDYTDAERATELPKLEETLPASLYDDSNPRGLKATANNVVDNAIAIRDRLSLDAFRIFRNIQEDFSVEYHAHSPTVTQSIFEINRLLTHLLAFSGLTAESVTRTHGWRFIMLGRRLERLDLTVDLLSATLGHENQDEPRLCAAILEAADSLMTYRSRYLSLTRTEPTIDLLVTDESNPRSLRFQLEEIQRVIRQLPGEAKAGPTQSHLDYAERLLEAFSSADTGKLTAANDNGERETLNQLLSRTRQDAKEIAEMISLRYLIHSSVQQTLTGQQHRQFSGSSETDSGFSSP